MKKISWGDEKNFTPTHEKNFIHNNTSYNNHKEYIIIIFYMSDFENFLKEYLKTKQSKTILIENGINLFINDFSKTRRPKTIEFYKDHLKPFIIFCEMRNIKCFNELTNELIQAYINKLKYANNENKTINKRISLIRLVMNYLYVNDYISEYKLIFPILEVKEKEIKAINDNQLIKLLHYANNSLNVKKRLIVLLLVATGIRRNELVNIKIDNIDFYNKRIYLDYTKNKKARYIFVNNDILDLISKLIKHNKQKVYLFENKKGKQLSSNYITQTLYYIKNELNFEVLSPHKLRHTYATFLLKKGANQEEVRRLLGHNDFRMTKRYIDYVDTDLQFSNNQYNPLNLINNHKKDN